MWPYLLANGRRKKMALLLGDALLVAWVCLLGAVRAPESLAGLSRQSLWGVLAVVAGAALVAWAPRAETRRRRPEILALFLSGSLFVLFGLLVPESPAAFRHPLLPGLLLAGALACAWHGVAEKVVFPPLRLLLVDSSPLLAELGQLLSREPASYQVVDRVAAPSRLDAGELQGLLRRRRVDLVVCDHHLLPQCEALVPARLQGLPVWDAATFFQNLTGRVPVGAIGPDWLLQCGRRLPGRSRLAAWGKRLLDLCLAVVLLPVALPLLALCALAIKLDSPGPVFFLQERLGKDGVPFRLFKLRTMVVDAEQAGPQWCRDHDPRITRVGRILRRLRLDELPQIFNVLKNDMSFVGPRPIRAHFTEMLAREIPFYRLRLLTKPGLSGWAQVHSGHTNTVAAHALMLQYDLFYLLHQSLFLDLLVIAKTLRVILTGQGR